MTSTKHRVTRLVLLVLGVGTAVAVAAPSAALPAATTAVVTVPGVEAPPALSVKIAMRDLDHPWDVAFTPDGVMLVSERDLERIVARMPGGETRVLADSPEGVWHHSETGMMGMVVAPDFATTGTIYVCHGWNLDGIKDVRVTQWRIDPAYTSATIERVVVSGMRINVGKHAGCRLRFSPNGALYISTGDSRVGPLPQDKTSLNGKVLRVDPATGEGWPTNPYIDSPNANKRKVFTYGHRNAQGLSWRKGPDVPHEMWSVEQGTDRDDEVNRLRPGGNYGWNPMPPPYNPEAPMTDKTLPGRQLGAKWSSGFPTRATSGGAWITGSRWGAWRGAFAVGALKASQLLIMTFDARGTLLTFDIPPELDLTHGRLREPVIGPHNALYITTDNGFGQDVILKVTPMQ